MIGEVAIRGPVPGGHVSNPADVAVAGAPRWVLGEGGYDMKTLDAPAYKHTNTHTLPTPQQCRPDTHMYHSSEPQAPYCEHSPGFSQSLPLDYPSAVHL